MTESQTPLEGNSPLKRPRGRPLGSKNKVSSAAKALPSPAAEPPRRGRPRKVVVAEPVEREVSVAASAQEVVASVASSSTAAPAVPSSAPSSAPVSSSAPVEAGVSGSSNIPASNGIQMKRRAVNFHVGGAKSKSPLPMSVSEVPSAASAVDMDSESGQGGSMPRGYKNVAGSGNRQNGYRGNNYSKNEGGYRNDGGYKNDYSGKSWGDGYRNDRWKDNRNQKRRYDNGGRFDMDHDDERFAAGSASDYEGRHVIDLLELQKLSTDVLVGRAQESGIEGAASMSRHDLLFDMVKQACVELNGLVRGGGTLEIVQGGDGYLRNEHFSYVASPGDVFIHKEQIRRWGMRTGDMVIGQLHLRERERSYTLQKVDSINGEAPERRREVRGFENLVPYFPTQRIFLEREDEPHEISMRVIDLVTPIGRGQRGLIVAAPRTGKTIVMQKMANSIVENNPDIELIVLLIDERPEEVTDMRRVVKGEVVSSTFDEPPDRHIQVAEMVIEKAKRKVEYGRHVVILLDSITRLARAYNTVEPHSGRILSGGVDANALHKPKRFFGAARNIEGGGSLTILATALIDTGSRMDEVIFEEFKGTGNMELDLERRLAEKRIYPAVSIEKSGTRREELIVHPEELKVIWFLRKALLLLQRQSREGLEILLGKLKDYRTNREYLQSIRRALLDDGLEMDKLDKLSEEDILDVLTRK